MIKTLKTLAADERESIKPPKTINDVIPISRIWDDGIFLAGNRYSACYRFPDINYAVASEADRKDMSEAFQRMINSLDPAEAIKFSVFNRRITKNSLSGVLHYHRNDMNDPLRDELNSIIKTNSRDSDGIFQDKFITLSVVKDRHKDAKHYFETAAEELRSKFRALSSDLIAMPTADRLQMIRSFLRSDEEYLPPVELKEYMLWGRGFLNEIAPRSLSVEKDYMRIGSRYARALYLKDYAVQLSDSMLMRLSEMRRDMIMSVDIVPIPKDEAIKDVQKRLLGVESEITKWQQRQNKNNNFSAEVPYELNARREELKSFLDKLNNDMRMMSVSVTIVHMADSKAMLDKDTEAFLSIASGYMCKYEKLKYQQLQGLKTALPFGALRTPNTLRSLTSAGAAMLTPFRAETMSHSTGVYFGRNTVTRSLIFIDRTLLMNGNGFYLGTSGSGKSFFAKGEIASLILKGNADVMILDPEREYVSLIRRLGGSVISLSASSNNHINALQLSPGDTESEKPLDMKSQFVQSLCEQIMGEGVITAQEKSVIDRCLSNIFRSFFANGWAGPMPTLKDFYKELLWQKEPEAKNIALAIELFTKGSLDTFAQETNVDLDNHAVCFDIRDMGEQLKPVAMLVILDTIYNRILYNKARGRATFVFIDEIYLFFSNEFSSNFLFEQWKRARKYGAYYTGISQNVEDLLQSNRGRAMLANSEFVTLLNQAATDRLELSQVLGISDTQLSYVTNAEIGTGLLVCGGSIVPFENRFPENTMLYKLMTTKPMESMVC